MSNRRAQPADQSPRLDLPTLGGQRFDLHRRGDDDSCLLIFYRGLHCPKCRDQLRTFDAKSDEFRRRGIRLVAASMDDETRATEAKADWGLSDAITLAFALREDAARDWGLYLSSAEFDGEPERFCEPGLFLIDSNSRVYAAWIQSVPFARPQCNDLLDAIDFVQAKSYPPRGKVA